MPNEQITPETDGDITTLYEDTGEHDRTGGVIDTTDRVEIGNQEEEQP
ncbi:hypothetical protein ACFFK0_22285 [Paenibacillus chartarius]|uniref:DUF4025 domain-containing protein n=1 Tax=Paenibacillus chartarius TaxID=747481 RepID=A0ABV6DR46_9BACL